MRSLLRAREENHKDGSQVNQARFPDISRDELGCGLDGGEEERKVAGRGGAEAELVREDVARCRASRMGARWAMK